MCTARSRSLLSFAAVLTAAAWPAAARAQAEAPLDFDPYLVPSEPAAEPWEAAAVEDATAPAPPTWEEIDARAAADAAVAEADRWEKTGLTVGFFGGLAAFDAVEADGTGVDLDDSLLGGASIGYDFGLLRVDVQGLLSATEPIGDAFPELDVVGFGAGTVNLYVDVPLSRRFELYGGGGIGMGLLAINFDPDGNGASSDDDEDVDVEVEAAFAWTATAGVAFKLSPGSTLTLGARLTDLADVDLRDRSYDLDPVTSFEIGLRLTF